METFPIVKRRTRNIWIVPTKGVILEVYDAMAEAREQASRTRRSSIPRPDRASHRRA